MDMPSTGLQRILVAAVVFAAVYSVVPDIFVSRTRFLLAWDVASAAYLIWLLRSIVSADANATRKWAERHAPRLRGSVFATFAFAAVALASTGSLFHIAEDLPSWAKIVRVVLSFTAIATAWLIVHLSFALLYAHCFFWGKDEGGDGRASRGLAFPGDEPLVFLDFVYYAMTIGTCYQTSDISITRKDMRRLTMIHAVASFAFVTILLGFTVNILASVM